MTDDPRFVMSELNDARNKKKYNAQTRLISDSQLIDLRMKATNNPSDWLLYKKEDLLNNPSEEDFSIYKNYKNKYNNFFNQRKIKN